MTEKRIAPKGKITVNRLVYGEEVDKVEEIDVGMFETTPANVSVKAGGTVNLGNFESGRFDVMLSVPCYVEDIEDTYVNVRDWVDSKAQEEYQELKKAAKK